MAKVYQPKGFEQTINNNTDLFIKLNNDNTIRIQVLSDSIEIYPINGVELKLCSSGGCGPGIKFIAKR